jgi:hypothetical protein
MNNFKKYAITTGVLFIVYTSLDLLSSLFLGSSVTEIDLAVISKTAGKVGFGAFLLLIGGACASGIAVSLYPVLKRFSPAMALGAVGFRITEGVLRFVSVSLLLGLITLSQLYVKAGSLESSYFQTTGELLSGLKLWVGSGVGSFLAFSIGCSLYYIIFFQTRLIPRWLSIWGLVFGILGIVSCALVSTGLIPPFGTVQVIMVIPMLPQELVLAVWLIVKGFNPTVIATLSTNAEKKQLMGTS